MYKFDEEQRKETQRVIEEYRKKLEDSEDDGGFAPDDNKGLKSEYARAKRMAGCYYFPKIFTVLVIVFFLFLVAGLILNMRAENTSKVMLFFGALFAIPTLSLFLNKQTNIKEKIIILIFPFIGTALCLAGLFFISGDVISFDRVVTLVAMTFFVLGATMILVRAFLRTVNRLRCTQKTEAIIVTYDIKKQLGEYYCSPVYEYMADGRKYLAISPCYRIKTYERPNQKVSIHINKKNPEHVHLPNDNKFYYVSGAVLIAISVVVYIFKVFLV